MLPEEDRVRLQHMMDAAAEALCFAKGKTRAHLDSDRKLTLAIVRLIEIIGEAANQVSAATKGAATGIPWPSIVAMRNRIVHAYFDIDLDRVWETLTDDLPPLIAELSRLLGGRP